MRTPDHRFVTVGVVSCALLACSTDHTITHGADGSPEWDRRLRAAVPIGTQVNEARSIMERNGFKCDADPEKPSVMRCDKRSRGTLKIVRRRWQATFETADGRVSQIETSTG